METRSVLNPWRLAGWGAVAALLLLPAVAMQFPRDVAWTANDFAFGAVLAQAPSSPSAPSPAPSPATSPEDALPAGPGKDVVVRVCTACHDASQFAFARYTPEEWDGEIAKMQGAGAEVTAEEQPAISA